jgi:hypothetical protein
MHDQDNFDSQIMIWKVGWFGEGRCMQDGHLKYECFIKEMAGWSLPSQQRQQQQSLSFLLAGAGTSSSWCA